MIAALLTQQTTAAEGPAPQGANTSTSEEATTALWQAIVSQADHLPTPQGDALLQKNVIIGGPGKNAELLKASNLPVVSAQGPLDAKGVTPSKSAGPAQTLGDAGTNPAPVRTEKTLEPSVSLKKANSNEGTPAIKGAPLDQPKVRTEGQPLVEGGGPVRTEGRPLIEGGRQVPSGETSRRAQGPQPSEVNTPAPAQRPLEGSQRIAAPAAEPTKAVVRQESSAPEPISTPSTKTPDLNPGDITTPPRPVQVSTSAPTLEAPAHASPTPQLTEGKAPVTAEPARALPSPTSATGTQAPPVVEQVREAIIQRGSPHRIEVQLDPPELGRIQIEFEMRSQGQVRAIVTSSEGETLDLLRRQASTLMNDLKDSGFTDVELDWSSLEQRESEKQSRAPLQELGLLPTEEASLPLRNFAPSHDGELNLTL